MSELEKLVIGRMLADSELEARAASVDFDSVKVNDREFTGAGFLTEFDRSDALRLFPSEVNLRWGKVGARLNAAKVETGYLVYVDGGFITAIEGYTYGDEWPTRVDAIELYELAPGMELTTSRRE
jgi:hypothetical protein